MENTRALTAIAYKMIETFGDQAVAKLEAIVCDHITAGDGEGAVFWDDVAHAVRRLQSAIAVTEKRQTRSGL